MRFRHLLLITSALVPLAVTTANAGPEGANVVGGAATVTGQGGANVTINQTTDKAIINWNTFNIGVGQTTTFNQPNSGSIALNRIVGGQGPSEILGNLTANGKVFLVNRDGIIFGPGAVITTAGFLATTNDIRNEDFMAGKFRFDVPGRPDASIVNMGTITATSGGFAALVAPGVRNSGVITANLGTVTLASGNTFNLDFYGDKLIQLGVTDQIAGQVKDVATGQTLKSLVTNTGKLKANGGRVELSAVAARQVVDSVINTSGVIEANSVGVKNGQIVLSAATGGGNNRGGAALPTQTVRVAGKLSASGHKAGTKGGKIVITGENIQVAGATIKATGREGGGTVLIGGDWGGGKPDRSLTNNQSAVLDGKVIPTATTVSIDSASRIDASAKDNGNGGKVIVWSDNTTTFAGTILAMGGSQSGNGGFAEVSSKGLLNYTGVTDLRATNGSFGTLLLDPYNVTISAGTDLNMSSGNPFTPTDNTSNLNVTTLTNALALASVIVTTGGFGSPGTQTGNITVNAPVIWSSGSTLTLSAYNNIVINNNGQIANTGSGSLVLRADNSGKGTGFIDLPISTSNNRVDWSGSTGTVTVFYNPSSYTTPQNFTTPTSTAHFTLASPGQLTAYMLVNSDTNLQNVNQNLSGTYALGKDITSFINVPNFAPIGSVSTPFTGKFEGNSQTISGMVISPTTASVNNIGLFAAIGSSGIVRNFTIDAASVTANIAVSGGQFVGVLAGQNAGTISNVTVTNSAITNGNVQSGVIAGGIVGQNQAGGKIQNTIGTDTVNTVGVAVGDSSSGTENNAGGVAGVNHGTITGVVATNVLLFGGSHSELGGLVGRNESDGTIQSSSSSGLVGINPLTGLQNVAGGLVGFNFGLIDNSSSSATVIGAGTNNFFSVMLGGLVGMNGTDTISLHSGVITNSSATGAVSGGFGTTTGGFVGANTGNATISSSTASGIVSSLDNFVGGFVGYNTGTISGSHATGFVVGAGFGTGGFAGTNDKDSVNGHVGTITNSTAIGNVVDASTTGGNSVGGFVGDNRATITNSSASGIVSSNPTNTNPQNGGTVGGFAGSNDGRISGSQATGAVNVGAGSGGGGFVGANYDTGTISNSSSSIGPVTGTNDSILGGFAGGNFGLITFSSASNNVSSTGANSILGGFAGIGSGPIKNSSATGGVHGTSDSYLGGFIGINVGLIQDSTATGNVTGSGANNFAGGFVGANFGFIDPSTASGNVASGPNSTVGNFTGANLATHTSNGPDFIGTVSSDSTGSGSVNAGPGSNVGTQTGQNYPVTGIPNLPGNACGSGGFCFGQLFNPNGTPDLPVPHQPIPNQPLTDQPVVSPLVNLTATLVSDVFAQKKQDDVVNTNQNNSGAGSSGGTTGNQKGGGQGQGQGAGNAGRPAITVVPPVGLGPLPSGMPPINETRFATNEVVMQLGAKLTPEQVAALAAKFGLEVIYSQEFGLLGRTVYRFRITGGLSVRDAIAGLQSGGATISAQPLYNFVLTEMNSEPAAAGSTPAAAGSAPADTNRPGDSAQYIVAKLGLVEAHGIATGKGVKVAVIDSEIDSKHPDLSGVITGNYDALPSADVTPHPHGTGMAGAIGSHQRLLGVAPGAQILGVRAFGISDAGAQGTSMNIVKGLEWAVQQGAQIINMSFAGPRDPILEQAISELRKRGIILIAAAGNAGPKSPPLFPGADKNVIGVSATDQDDRTYRGANRGPQVAIAAPGVDILVPAPEGGYQLTTGTSVAAAHISGVVALMLERNPRLTPAEVKSILMATAKKLPQGKNEIGSGLVDPVQAITKSGPKQARAQ